MLVDVLVALFFSLSSADQDLYDFSGVEVHESGGFDETVSVGDAPARPNSKIDECRSPHHDQFVKVVSWAHWAGFPLDELHTAVAVAYAESLGDYSALNYNNDGSQDTGLWQINSIHGFSNLENPAMNAIAAFDVWQRQGWRAWYAHTPYGEEYGSGERFLDWLNKSQCSIDFYLSSMVQ